MTTPINWPAEPPGQNPSYPVEVVDIVEIGGDLRVVVRWKNRTGLEYFRPQLECETIKLALINVASAARALGRRINVKASTDGHGNRDLNADPGRIGEVSVGELITGPRHNGVVRDLEACGTNSDYPRRMRVNVQLGAGSTNLYLCPDAPGAILTFAGAAIAMASSSATYVPPPGLPTTSPRC
jgi:hypothetical protein